MLRCREKSLDTVIVFLPDGIEFMIVAARTTQCYAQKRRPDYIRHLRQDFIADISFVLITGVLSIRAKPVERWRRAFRGSRDQSHHLRAAPAQIGHKACPVERIGLHSRDTPTRSICGCRIQTRRSRRSALRQANAEPIARRIQAMREAHQRAWPMPPETCPSQTRKFALELAAAR